MKSLVNRAVLAWGKIRRMWFIYLRPKKTQDLLSLREGECQRCGACCKIAFECPALGHEDNQPTCKLYKQRSDVCKLFPIDERDIKDRDILLPHIKCGYRFNGNGNGNGNGGNGKHPE